jgi:hypothetical protein
LVVGRGKGRDRIPEQVSIHFEPVHGAEDLAFDNVKHVFPNFAIDAAKTDPAVCIRNAGDRGGGWSEPYLEEFFWTLEGAGRLVVVAVVRCHSVGVSAFCGDL